MTYYHDNRHYFEVGVNEDGWAVGLAYYDVARNSWLGSNKSSWILHYNGNSNYKVGYLLFLIKYFLHCSDL